MFLACKFPFFIILERPRRNHHHWSTIIIGVPQSFHRRPPDFQWRYPDFRWRAQSFHWRPQDFHRGPLIIPLKPQIFTFIFTFDHINPRFTSQIPIF